MSVLTVGETMALLDPLEEGELAHGRLLTLRLAGAESNFAVGLARLGIRVRWVSRLGADPLGDMIFDTLADEGIDLHYVVRDPAAPTGVFLKWRSGVRTQVAYYRKDSAASRLARSDIPDEALAGVRLVHLTGITLALSDGAAELVRDLARRAHEHGAQIVFDPNWRPALWGSPAEAAAAQNDVLPFVDWYLCGEEEGRVVFGTSDPASTLAAACAAGASAAVVRVGARGAIVRDSTGITTEVPSVREVTVLDEIGAGDAFAAGFAFGLLQGWRAPDCARIGNVLAAFALEGTGDWETLPRLTDIVDQLRPELRSVAS
jgi:2-dehydro-3-deoxygluconokinase